MNQHSVQRGVAILLGMLHTKETGIISGSLSLWLVCAFPFFYLHKALRSVWQWYPGKQLQQKQSRFLLVMQAFLLNNILKIFSCITLALVVFSFRLLIPSHLHHMQICIIQRICTHQNMAGEQAITGPADIHRFNYCKQM